MGSIFGNQIKISLFGESHGEGVGLVLDGFPAGLKIDETQLREELDRRKPGGQPWNSARKEGDLPQFISGVYKGKTTGSPICVLFRNQDTRSQDYKDLDKKFRPSHADYTGFLRYGGNNDPRGGGHFSGRLTTGMVLAGALAKQWLLQRNIVVSGHLSQVGKIKDISISEAMSSGLALTSSFPMFDSEASSYAQMEIESARMELDSIGAEVEVAVTGMPGGVGNPIFDTIEGELAKALFAVPAVKGVAFGSGFDLVSMRGSEANDLWIKEESSVTTTSNHNGGVLGGISSGQPIVLRAAIKPTASIGRGQETWDGEEGTTVLQIKGRHDPCIGPRALPVVEAMTAFVVMDFLMGHIGLRDSMEGK